MLVKSVRNAESPRADEAPRTVEEWIQMLGADDATTRRAAARELGSRPEAVPALCTRLGIEGAPSVRGVILTSLIRQKSQQAVEGLIPLLSSEDTALRNAVIEALQDMPDAVAPHMDKLLLDPDSDVRIFAVNILSLLPHPDAPRWLTRVISEDHHVNVCAAAVDCLAEVGDEAAIGPLIALQDRFANVPFMSFAIEAALRRIRGC
ncbi:MAG: HEAT repeat domain-containing protein [Xanthobacteraceae bacterium]